MQNKLVFSLLLLAFVFSVPSLFMYFVSEDLVSIVPEANFVTRLKSIWSGDILKNAGFYRPISLTSLLVDYKLWGLSSVGFHFTNLLFHIACVVTVYFFIFYLFNDYRIALLSSLIFILHPIHTYNLYWISGRGDMIATLFYILSLIFMMEFLKKQQDKFIVFTILFAVLGILGKETVITIPLAWLWIYIFLKNKNNVQKMRLKVLFLIIVFIFIFLILRFLILKGSFNIPGIYKYFNVSYYFKNILKLTGFLTIPFGYEFFELLYSKYPAIFLSTAIVCVFGMIIFFYFVCRKDKAFFYILIFFIIITLPFFQLVMRWYLYLPSVGFSLFIGYLIYKVKRGKKRYGRIILGIYLFLCVIGYMYYTYVWYLNSNFNKELIKKIIMLMKQHRDKKYFYIVNLPAKIYRCPTFGYGFEHTVRLFNEDTFQCLDRIVRTSHQYGYHSCNYKVKPDGIELWFDNPNSYFLLPVRKYILGEAGLKIGRKVDVPLFWDTVTVSVLNNHPNNKVKHVKIFYTPRMLQKDCMVVIFYKKNYKIIHPQN